MSPHGIFTRPDGVRIWGSVELVIDTPEGPKKPIQTIFGKDMPEGSIPTEQQMDQMIKKAFPDDEPKAS